jgi:hypothetical protein
MATRAALKPANAETVEDVLDQMDAAQSARRGVMSVDLVNALAEIEGATKDKVNPHFKSKYADIGSVIDAIKPVLAKHNLAFYQRPQPSEGGVLVQTMLRHTSGEEVDLGTLYVPANKNDAQGFGSALTYARRYALMTAFGVPAEDDDGNAAARSSANPTTGETPPAKRVKLDGPYTSATSLKTACHEFAKTLERMGDMGELIAWENTRDYTEFVDQVSRDAPHYWFGSDTMPAEFIPLSIRVANKRRELEELEGLRA